MQLLSVIKIAQRNLLDLFSIRPLPFEYGQNRLFPVNEIHLYVSVQIDSVRFEEECFQSGKAV